MKARFSRQRAVCLTEEMAEALEYLAAAEGISVSQLLRKITSAFLAHVDAMSASQPQANGRADHSDNHVTR